LTGRCRVSVHVDFKERKGKRKCGAYISLRKVAELLGVEDFAHEIAKLSK